MEASLADSPAAAGRRTARRGRWLSLAAKAGVSLVGLVLLLGAALFLFLDTDAGHRFLTDRVAAMRPSSGLRIEIGRIEGSIWGKARLRAVRAYDPQGVFAEAPSIDVEWRPLGWVANRLIVDELHSDLVLLHRLPKFRPGDGDRPILPDFDIRIGRFEVEQLRIGKAVTGQERVARIVGEADIRSGRALVDLDANVRGGDRLALRIDSEPDRDRFDVDVRLSAPAGGVAGAMLGTRRPIELRVSGDGSWTRWTGSARLGLSGKTAADLSLSAAEGRYRLRGLLHSAQFLRGKLARLTAPRVQVDATATLEDRILDGRVSLRSAALKLETRGALDLGSSAFRDVRIGTDLLQPSALFRNMTGRAVRLTALLDGPFRSFAFAYRITSPRVAFDDTGFEDVRAEGRGRWSKPPVRVPVLLVARRVTGVGDVAGGILANLRVEGVLAVTGRQITGEGLALSSDKLKGTLGLFVDLVTGRYDVVLSGGMTRYLIPGLGIVDVTTELKVVPGPGGQGSLVTGKGRAWVRRFDNRFLLSLAGGLPYIETDLLRGRDKILHLRNLRLTAPGIRIAANGYRRRDGTFYLEGSGTQEKYGAFAMTLDGRIERPKMAIRLARPNDELGLADVLLELDPTPQGFAYRAGGQSHLGLFQARGAILLPSGRPAHIQFAALEVSGTRATGTLRSDPGGFTGRLNVAGGGLDGTLLFSPVGSVQRIEAHLAARNARFAAGETAISIRQGKLDGVFLLNPDGTSIEADLAARGFSRGGLYLARLDAKASLRGGRGQVKANIAGTRGRDFVFETLAEVAPDRIRLSGSGTVDRRPFRLSEAAVLTRIEDGWRLAPTAFSFAGGNATLAGTFGDSRTEFDARMDAMPLTVLDIPYPRLGLGGIASGTLRYRSPRGGAAPTGAMDLRIRGLTRSGLVLSSRPVDIGLVAKLDGRNAAMRAIAVSDGRTIGRAQARIAPIGTSGDIADRLASAPLFAQLRYNGAADTLWRLTGLEMMDLSGPVAVGADATGSWNNPQIRGSIRTEKARLESAVTGMVVENIQARGRFGGSRLLVDSFAGATKKGGRVTGRGSFDLAAANGFAMDVALQADRAQLIDRDDLKAQVTGPISIRSDGRTATIGGAVRLASGSFRLGSATASARLPRLEVRELNRPEDAPVQRRATMPWQLDLEVKADDQLEVTGLGMSSEWSADLKIGGTIGEPRISGEAQLVRGNYDFAGRRFDLERGTIRFFGETPVNPALDIVAEGGVQGVNATIRVTGRGEKPEITFASTPALPEDELLSRLLFGTSITNLSAPEALQLAAAVASLNDTSGGLDPINALRRATGLDRLRIVPADITTGQGTALAAGKYLGRGIYVEVVSDASGYSATQVEYQITRWLSLLSSISTIGRESVNVRVSKDY